MSIWFMTDCHTFLRLDGKPVKQAMEELEKAVESEGGYGFVGCKGEHGNKTFQWKPSEPWRDHVAALLRWAA